MKSKDLKIGQRILIVSDMGNLEGFVVDKKCIDSVNYIYVGPNLETPDSYFQFYEDWELDSKRYKIYEII